jgi:membrane protein implicated in regulation of membrane protease activity
MNETLVEIGAVLLTGFIAYWLLETLISAVFLRHVPKLPADTDKTPPGSTAEVVGTFSMDGASQRWVGHVKIYGELWQARYNGDRQPREGERLRVVGREGLLLDVEPIL